MWISPSCYSEWRNKFNPELAERESVSPMKFIENLEKVKQHETSHKFNHHQVIKALCIFNQHLKRMGEIILYIHVYYNPNNFI